jgi:hypothetical protein
LTNIKQLSDSCAVPTIFENEFESAQKPVGTFSSHRRAFSRLLDATVLPQSCY